MIGVSDALFASIITVGIALLGAIWYGVDVSFNAVTMYGVVSLFISAVAMAIKNIEDNEDEE